MRPRGAKARSRARRRRGEGLLALLLISLALLAKATAPPEVEGWGQAAAGGPAGKAGGEANEGPGGTGEGGSSAHAPEAAAGKAGIAAGNPPETGGEGPSDGNVGEAQSSKLDSSDAEDGEAEEGTGQTNAAGASGGEAAQDDPEYGAQISLIQPSQEHDEASLLMCTCIPLGGPDTEPVQLWLDPNLQQCPDTFAPGAGATGDGHAAKEKDDAPAEQPPPRLKRQLPDPDEYFMAEKQHLLSGGDSDQQVAPTSVPVVDGLNQCDPSLSERANMASVKMGAKVLAANQEATRLSEVLKNDPDTYLKSDCKTKEGRWLILELPQVIKVEAVTLSVMEVYSSRLKTIHVLGRDGRLGGGAAEVANSRNSTEWITIAELHAENRRGLHVFMLPQKRWAKFLQFRFEGHYGNQMVCAVNEIEVFGLTKAEEILKELEAVAGGPDVGGSGGGGGNGNTEPVVTEQISQAHVPAASPAPPPPLSKDPVPSVPSVADPGAAEDAMAPGTAAAEEQGGAAPQGDHAAAGPAASSPSKSAASEVAEKSPAEVHPPGETLAAEGPKPSPAVEPPPEQEEERVAAGSPKASQQRAEDLVGAEAAEIPVQDASGGGAQEQQPPGHDPAAPATETTGGPAPQGPSSGSPQGPQANGERQLQDAPPVEMRLTNASSVIHVESPGGIPAVDMSDFAVRLTAAGAGGPSAVVDMFIQELKLQKLEQVYNKRYMKDAVANITLLFAEHDELVSSLQGEINGLRASLKALEGTSMDQASAQEKRLKRAVDEAEAQLRAQLHELSATVSAMQRQQALLLVAVCVLVVFRGGRGTAPKAPGAPAVQQPAARAKQEAERPGAAAAAAPLEQNGSAAKPHPKGPQGKGDGMKKKQQQKQQQKHRHQPPGGPKQEPRDQRPAAAPMAAAPAATGPPKNPTPGLGSRVRWVLWAGMLIAGWLGLGDAKLEVAVGALLRRASAMLWP